MQNTLLQTDRNQSDLYLDISYLANIIWIINLAKCSPSYLSTLPFNLITLFFIVRL